MLTNLKSCQDLTDLAHLLGYKPATLSYMLYKVPDAQKYTTFQIPKKNGQLRQIDAPVPGMKFLQRALARVLYDCVKEIEEGNPRRFRAAFGFLENRGLPQHADLHHCRRWVFNCDLEGFFPSIHIGRVRGFFERDKLFSLEPKVALLIGQIVCHNGTLPQGAPTSPIISELIASLLDARMVKLAAAHGCRYSRYADDLTFSTNQRDFPADLAIQDDTDHGWSVAQELESRIVDAGYSVNSNKTRMAVRSSRQMVTGLVVNRKVTVRSEYYKSTRAMCHRLFKGESPREDRFHVPKDEQELATLPYIEGRLSHQFHLYEKLDGRSFRLRQDEPTAFEKLYRDFLLAKWFFYQEKPVVIAEGKTDFVYISLALHKDFAADPDFFGSDGLRIMPYKYPKRVHDFTGLGAGTGNLTRGMVRLLDFVRRYPSLEPRRPVIFVVDNDKGGRSFTNQCTNLWKKKFSGDNSEDFVKLRPGLYVVRTPPVGVKTDSYIESFLPKKVLGTKINGKTFSASNDLDTDKHFGKFRLSQHVSKNVAGIDLTGFAPLVERVRRVLVDFETTSPQPNPAPQP